MKDIPSTRGLFESFNNAENKSKNKTHSVTANQVAEAEARMKAQSTLMPKLSDHKHKTTKIIAPNNFIA
ncbi:MAG: hypothetical protein V3W18_13325 [candidate division Zixibacteria bacterium]